MEIFDKQPNEYKTKIIPERRCIKVSMEAGITNGWEKYTGINGLNIAINHYGASAPGSELANKYGFTSTKVEQVIRLHIKSLL